jgi:hypothetical protein
MVDFEHKPTAFRDLAGSVYILINEIGNSDFLRGNSGRGRRFYSRYGKIAKNACEIDAKTQEQ